MKPPSATDLSQALFEEAGDALILFDPESDRVLDANPTTQRLSGFSRQELLRMAATYLFRFDGKGGMNRLRQASRNTGFFHAQDGYFLRTNEDPCWIPVNLTIARLHVQPRTLGLITARDVREQREATTQLARMERALATLMSNLPGMAYRCRNKPDWTMEFVSDGAFTLTGYPASDLVGNYHVSYADLIHPDDRERVWAEVQAAVAADQPFQCTYRIRTARREEKWVWEQGRAVRTGAADTPVLEGFVIDITERKRAEADLAHERDVLHTLMDNVPDHIYFKDRESRFTRVNNGQAAYLGLTDWRQAVGKSDFDFYAHETARLFYEDERRIVETGQPILNKVEYQSGAAGTPRWILTTKVPFFDRQGQVVGIAGVSKDITQQKEVEATLTRERALLRSLIDSIPDLIFYKDINGRYLGCNVAFAKYAGREAEELVGRTDHELLPRDLADFYRERDRQVLGDGRARRDEEWIELPDGRQLLVETVQTPFFGAGEQVLGLIGVSRDITERKRLEEQLRQAQKMEAVGQLAGGVAHDFNNLLTAILGNVSLLLSSKPASDPDHELLAATEQAAQRATDLTRQLLGFSRQTMLRLEPTDLNASIGEIVAILRRTIDPSIFVDVRPAPALWLVQADPGQMNQVLMNLCINARDAMPQGGTLCLETENLILDESTTRLQLEARSGAFVRLRVRDTGQGIPPDVRPRIFEPFFTTKGPGKGTGLGLAMVYGIVKQHRGWIECVSEPGRGTYFDMYLPRFQEAAAAGSRPSAPTASVRGTETIMLVDDEAVIRNVGRAILQRHGYQVVLAADGREALEIYQQERDQIHLVILDLTMPRLSGRDTLRQLVQLNPRVAVLLSSGYSAEQLPEVGKEGVWGFVNKPYRPQDLVVAVRSALDRLRGTVPLPSQPQENNWVI